MRKLGYLLILAIVCSACIEIKDAKTGDIVTSVTLKDLETGKCVKAVAGEGGSYTVVPCP